MTQIMTQIGRILFLFFIITGCSLNINEEEMKGTYTAKKYLKTIDTIKLLEDNNYYRVVYSKSGEKIFENTGKWFKENKGVVFSDFLVNNDELSSDFKYDERDLTNAHLGIKHYFNRIRIYENYDKGYYWQLISPAP